jgi:hypothetical protein
MSNTTDPSFEAAHFSLVGMHFAIPHVAGANTGTVVGQVGPQHFMIQQGLIREIVDVNTMVRQAWAFGTEEQVKALVATPRSGARDPDAPRRCSDPPMSTEKAVHVLVSNMISDLLDRELRGEDVSIKVLVDRIQMTIKPLLFNLWSEGKLVCEDTYMKHLVMSCLADGIRNGWVIEGKPDRYMHACAS